MSNQASKSSAAPYEGLADKVSTIQEFYPQSLGYADVRALAEDISFDDDGKLDIKGFFAKLKSMVRYLPDPTDAEFIKAPWIMVGEIHDSGHARGDCDDLASLAYTLLHSVGIDAALYVAWFGADENPSHIFVGIPQKGSSKYKAFDLCANAYGETIPGYSQVVGYA